MIEQAMLIGKKYIGRVLNVDAINGDVMICKAMGTFIIILPLCYTITKIAPVAKILHCVPYWNTDNGSYTYRIQVANRSVLNGRGLRPKITKNFLMLIIIPAQIA